MARVITFSKVFPSYHFRKGEPTFFIEKFLNSIYKNKDIPYGFYTLKKYDELNLTFDETEADKHHTIRLGNRWKSGDFFSPRVWSGKPYNSKQIIIAPDTEIKNVWDIEIWTDNTYCFIGIKTGENEWSLISFGEVAKNDGLTPQELKAWFKLKPNQDPIKAQIICWSNSVKY